MFKIPLHYQILIALILGSVFGAVFHISSNVLIIEFAQKTKKNVEIINWHKVFFTDSSDLNIAQFDSSGQSKIIHFFDSYKNKSEIVLNVQLINKSLQYRGIKSIRKEKTIATVIKPIGDIFIRLLSMLAIPLVISSLVVGAASLGDIKKLGRIGIKTFSLFMATTFIAITIGLVLANVIAPGDKIGIESKEKLFETYSNYNLTTPGQKPEIDIIDFFVNMVPKNAFYSISSGDMLQIVFFVVFFGISLTFVSADLRNPVIAFFNGASETLIKMVDFVMFIAPLGVFALISSTVAGFGFDILSTLIWYILTVILGLVLHFTFIYLPLVKFGAKVSIKKYIQGMRNAQAIAFTTSSSAATLPVTMECVEENLGVSKKIAGFVLPLGATINMDGTALYQAVATIFIAQVYGIDLNLSQQITIVITAVLASIGTAPVPGVGIIMLVMILESVNVPAAGIGLILGVDRILDMARTVNNVMGDSSTALVVNYTERNK